MPTKLKIVFVFYWLLLFNCNFVSAETNQKSQNFLTVNSAAIPANITLKINGASYDLSKAEILNWIKEKNALVYKADYNSEIENNNFCIRDKYFFCKLLFSIKNEKHIKKTSTFLLDTNAVTKFVDDLSRQTNKDPVDAKLIMENGKAVIFSLSQKGVELNKEQSVSALIGNFKQKNISASLNLPYIQKDPEISTNSIDNLGIIELLGEGRSNFSGSPKNRIFNIKVATNRFNGTLIKPREEFSFVKILGEVDGEHGYLPELVIKKNKTEPEFGGGICQVSTTAFRAAIYSGLKITSRKNHAYPVSYYNPQGMDSTVYVPRPDLRFVNNTPAHILIQTEIIGTELVFRFFGTTDGRKTIVIGPKILEKNPDGSMKTTFSQQVSDATGKLIREDIFNSSYDSPDKYPHPRAVITQKPADWSKNKWLNYLADHKNS